MHPHEVGMQLLGSGVGGAVTDGADDAVEAGAGVENPRSRRNVAHLVLGRRREE